MTEYKSGNGFKPEAFQGGTIRFVQAGEGNLNGKFTIWPDSVKIRGIAKDEIRLPTDCVAALFKRIMNDDQIREFIGV